VQPKKFAKWDELFAGFILFMFESLLHAAGADSADGRSSDIMNIVHNHYSHI
jgi:hypothetical protein